MKKMDIHSRYHSEVFPLTIIDYVKALQQRPLCGKAKRKNICKRNYCSMQYYTGRDDHKKYPAFADISEVGEMNRDNVAISGDWEARINLATVIASPHLSGRSNLSAPHRGQTASTSIQRYGGSLK